MTSKWERWIGEEIDSSGSYGTALIAELSERLSDSNPKLYNFRPEYGNIFTNYYISDDKVIEHIENLIDQKKKDQLRNCLYKLIIDKFGITEFLTALDHQYKEHYKDGFRNGKEYMQNEFRQLIGV